MLSISITALVFSVFVIIFACLFAYLLFKVSKLTSKVKSISESPENSSHGLKLEEIERSIKELENKAAKSRPLLPEPGLPGPPGNTGPRGPPGRTLIQDINELFQGRDEIEIFKQINETIINDKINIDTVISSFSEEESRLEAIEKIKENLSVNAKSLFGIKNLRKLKDETAELCKEVFICYEKYIRAYEKLYKSKDIDCSERIENAEQCKKELKVFEEKIIQFNQNLETLIQKKREFYLGEKVEPEEHH